MDRKFNKKVVWGGIGLGLALMASYFGAGNVVIPASIGYAAGSKWSVALLGFFLSGILLPIISFLGISVRGGDIDNLMEPLGKRFSQIYFFLMMIPLMVLIGVPRMVAVSYELGFNVLIKGVPVMVYAAFFVVLVYICIRNPQKALDIVGKYLTPILLVMLSIIVLRVIFVPIAQPRDLGVSNVLGTSMLTGYGTGDVTASFMFASVFTVAIGMKVTQYGGESLKVEDRKKAEHRMLAIVLVVDALALLFVYGGLLYMGAMGTGIYHEPMDQTTLTVRMIQEAVGSFGMVCFAIAVILACFTTAVSAVNGMADYVRRISGDKLSHRVSAIILLAIIYAFSKLSVAKILAILIVIMGVTYPPVIIIVLLAFVYDRIPEERRFGLYLGSVLVAFVLEFLVALNSVGVQTGTAGFISKLPLAGIGFEWVIPSLIGGILGYFLIKKSPAKKEAA